MNDIKEMTFQDIDLLDVGIKITLFGAIFEGNGKHYYMPLPDADVLTYRDPVILRMDAAEWERFLNQSDVLDVRGPAKAILRKSQRHIDRIVQWQVWERDGYRCRYCGKKAPLTVDHVILWENGGASVADNLISSCGKCNKLRGNMPYEAWLASPEYAHTSRALDPLTLKVNELVATKLKHLESITAKPRSR